MNIQELYLQVEKLIEEKSFEKAIIGNVVDKSSSLKSVLIKQVIIKNELQLQFIYRYATKEEAKNYTIKNAEKILVELLPNTFLNIDVFCANKTLQVIYTGEKFKLKTKIIESKTTTIQLEHDKHKIRKTTVGANNYLYHLGIASKDGQVLAAMQHKYKQINQYIELIAAYIKNNPLNNNATIVDMGSGKGYLTFALYDYLVHNLKINAKVIGIEVRPDLIEKCNNIAKQNNFTNLHFKEGAIANYTPTQNVDLLIALHACDTATDDALYIAKKHNINSIIVAPCCHKQVRRDMQVPPALSYIQKHGIVAERQAEILTDTMRALWLETNNYKTQIMEFVDVNDTPKNIMILATKRQNPTSDLVEKASTSFNTIKATFGIKEHYLEQFN